MRKSATGAKSVTEQDRASLYTLVEFLLCVLLLVMWVSIYNGVDYPRIFMLWASSLVFYWFLFPMITGLVKVGFDLDGDDDPEVVEHTTPLDDMTNAVWRDPNLYSDEYDE